MTSLHALAALTLLLPGALGVVAGCTGSVYAPFAALANPGGRPAGAACAVDSACASDRCSAEVVAGTCGECLTIMALGEDCAGPHQGCSHSAVCKDGVCTSLRKTEGEPCSLGGKGDDQGDCDLELYCGHENELFDPGSCLRRTPLGESCGDGAKGRCVVGAWCRDGACAGPTPCNGTYFYGECFPGVVCGQFEYPTGVGADGTPSTCLPLPGKGEPCLHEACGEGLFCLRSGENESHPYCDSTRGEGEACSNDFYLEIGCATGLECRAYTCQIACH
jgi:hypothetical protein